MKPIQFEGCNSVIGANQPQYLPLPALRYNDKNGNVSSCWKLSFRERIKVLLSGRIYLTLKTFNNPIQPQLLSTNLRFVNEEISKERMGR